MKHNFRRNGLQPSNIGKLLIQMQSTGERSSRSLSKEVIDILYFMWNKLPWRNDWIWWYQFILMATSLSALNDKAIEAMQRSSATLRSLLVDANDSSGLHSLELMPSSIAME
jgi:hypothetical protein